ncbi:MAG: hypothetical protein SNJ84_07880 [Verrucomicrobiia bacterium]
MKRLAAEKRTLILQCASDRVALAVETESFRDATRWVNLLADGVAFMGPKLSTLAPALLGLFAARSAGLANPKLLRLGKVALIAWKVVREGWAFWKRTQNRRALVSAR